MNQTPRIELASPADRDSVIALLSAQLEDHGIGLPKTRLVTAVDAVLAGGAPAFCLVARLLGRSVGVAYVSLTWSLEHGGLSAWLDELYVEPRARNRGIGSALLEAICEQARVRGCCAIDLEVERGHERAARLYLRRGFRRHERQRFVLAL